jgi:uncharacterized membrane protein YoaK (UPF0700 family)
MLRRKKFTRFEVILYFFATLLFVSGAGGVFLAAARGHWRLALASFSILGIATVYLVAARRGMPAEARLFLFGLWTLDPIT